MQKVSLFDLLSPKRDIIINQNGWYDSNIFIWIQFYWINLFRILIISIPIGSIRVKPSWIGKSFSKEFCFVVCFSPK